jgi:hypothetical protein
MKLDKLAREVGKLDLGQMVKLMAGTFRADHDRLVAFVHLCSVYLREYEEAMTEKTIAAAIAGFEPMLDEIDAMTPERLGRPNSKKRERVMREVLGRYRGR